MIMQARQHSSARGVEHVFTALRCQSVADFCDVRLHPNIDDRAVQQCGALNQHARASLSEIMRRTAVLSAPSDDAGGLGGGR